MIVPEVLTNSKLGNVRYALETEENQYLLNRGMGFLRKKIYVYQSISTLIHLADLFYPRQLEELDSTNCLSN